MFHELTQHSGCVWPHILHDVEVLQGPALHVTPVSDTSLGTNTCDKPRHLSGSTCPRNICRGKQTKRQGTYWLSSWCKQHESVSVNSHREVWNRGFTP